jgi:AraC family transcriptional regulator
VHLLVMYGEGTRQKGKTSINGVGLSTSRQLANKLTFVPAGHTYSEWHEVSSQIHLTYIYLDPTKLRRSANSDASFVPRLCFEDPLLRETAAKLKRIVESGQAEIRPYLEALTNVLAHELPCSGHDFICRSGLAGWQTHVVTSYVEAHLDEQLSVVALARLTRLSKSHFCRAFKKSFGIPLQKYQLGRRIQWAKVLLLEGATSVADIGCIVGYSLASSFTAAFRKSTGQTPSAFRRNFG